PRGLRNYFGYLTYVQFMMDHGRNLQPDGNQHVTLSMDSGYCPLRTESVAGRRFEFPPRTQPMHAMRRATIAAIDVAIDRNRRVPSATHRDRIGVVTFDTPEGSTVRHPLTSDYVQAMTAISKLQAVGDKATTTATATGLRVAQEMLRPESKGGQARDKSTKIVILMTDGMPNAYEVADGELEEFARKDDSGEAYGEGYFWLDAALLRTYALRTAKVDVFPVGVGLGTDYDFMDRAARIGGTGGDDGQARRGTGNPAEYEALLTKMFEEIISLPTARLVE
ncbi:MAG: vWA domain-containing protein, partial [Planctomycetota bacterium]